MMPNSEDVKTVKDHLTRLGAACDASNPTGVVVMPVDDQAVPAVCLTDDNVTGTYDVAKLLEILPVLKDQDDFWHDIEGAALTEKEAPYKEFGDFAECVTYCNQLEIGDGSYEGDWFYCDDESLTIYDGTFGNDHSPGASDYTHHERYETKEEYEKHKAKYEDYPEYLETEDWQDEDDEEDDWDDEEESEEPDNEGEM